MRNQPHIQEPLSTAETKSSLYSEDLAPVPVHKRTWGTWHLAALWVGMAVCIPTWMLASQMITSGLTWVEALLIIGLANIVITLPMVLNGHPGVKYGIPFPVFGRAAFGIYGIHLPAIVRALVACGWFGIQTWIGGLAIGAILATLSGVPYQSDINTFNIIGFAVFWLISMYFVVAGTESIKWLEEFSAPVLIVMGILLIVWGTLSTGGMGEVLDQTKQLRQKSIRWETGTPDRLLLSPLVEADGLTPKASEFAIAPSKEALKNATWQPIQAVVDQPTNGPIWVQLRQKNTNGWLYSSPQWLEKPSASTTNKASFWTYILWFTAMVGFWATMSISISDITRLAKSQKAQIAGQFIGLPGTMMLFSFIGVFVTCASLLIFPDVMIAEDAPWDPVSVLARFSTPWVVIAAQCMMLVATLSTNIAANVIAPATAFSNLLPKWISYRTGGILTGIIGILICPWWLIHEISSILILISGLLGPVLGILMADYFWIRKTKLDVAGLYQTQGPYTYNAIGIHPAAWLALFLGVAAALIGLWIPSLRHAYDLSWFTGFITSALLYRILFPLLQKNPTHKTL